MIDLFCCILALPPLVLGVVLMTIITKLCAPGPVFYRQERVGFKGQRFKIWKFRTMGVAADAKVHRDHFKKLLESNAPMLKLDDKRDTRLIPGGWLLRASGMDELPQLFNILRGEMSIVGPRPCIPSEFAEYLPAHLERFDAVPGLTGLWQVSGKNRTTFEEMIQFDIHYARHASVLLNLKIIFLTPKALLIQIRDTYKGRNATGRTGAQNPQLRPQMMTAP